MIIASFSEDKRSGSFTLKLSGHAGAAEVGHDIVCASASILAYTVAQVAQNMDAEGLLVEPPYIRMESGDAEIIVKPTDDSYYETRWVFYTAQIGYALLNEQYPQYVELIEPSKTDFRS